MYYLHAFTDITQMFVVVSSRRTLFISSLQTIQGSSIFRHRVHHNVDLTVHHVNSKEVTISSSIFKVSLISLHENSWVNGSHFEEKSQNYTGINCGPTPAITFLCWPKPPCFCEGCSNETLTIYRHNMDRNTIIVFLVEDHLKTLKHSKDSQLW